MKRVAPRSTARTLAAMIAAATPLPITSAIDICTSSPTRKLSKKSPATSRAGTQRPAIS